MHLCVNEHNDSARPGAQEKEHGGSHGGHLELVEAPQGPAAEARAGGCPPGPGSHGGRLGPGGGPQGPAAEARAGGCPRGPAVTAGTSGPMGAVRGPTGNSCRWGLPELGARR
jgi:hypothetical protein